jgi:hypothetical protein
MTTVERRRAWDPERRLPGRGRWPRSGCRSPRRSRRRGSAAAPAIRASRGGCRRAGGGGPPGPSGRAGCDGAVAGDASGWVVPPPAGCGGRSPGSRSSPRRRGNRPGGCRWRRRSGRRPARGSGPGRRHRGGGRRSSAVGMHQPGRAVGQEASLEPPDRSLRQPKQGGCLGHTQRVRGDPSQHHRSSLFLNRHRDLPHDGETDKVIEQLAQRQPGLETLIGGRRVTERTGWMTRPTRPTESGA